MLFSLFTSLYKLFGFTHFKNMLEKKLQLRSHQRPANDQATNQQVTSLHGVIKDI